MLGDRCSSEGAARVYRYFVHERDKLAKGQPDAVAQVQEVLEGVHKGKHAAAQFPLALTDRGVQEWGPESGRNVATAKWRAVDSDHVPFARIAGSQGGRGRAQHEGLNDLQTPGLFQVRISPPRLWTSL